MCTEAKYYSLKDFDCIMICTVLSHAFDGNMMKKLCRKYKYGGELAGRDPNYAFYTIHQECHKKESKLREALETMFARSFALIIQKVRALPDAKSQIVPDSVRDLLEENTAAVLWALLTDPRETYQNCGTYLVHSSTLKTVKTKLVDNEHDCVSQAVNAEDQESKKRIKDLEVQLQARDKQIQKLEAERIKKGSKIDDLNKRPDKITAMERQIRKLSYEVDQFRKPVFPSLPEPRMPAVDQNCLLLTEIDGNDSCELSCDTECSDCELNQLKVAVVGGIDRMKPKYKNIIDDMGGQLLYHNGKCSGQRSVALRATICDADIVVFITTINSHNALHITKAECKKTGKQFIAMRETSPNRLKQLISSTMRK